MRVQSDERDVREAGIPSGKAGKAQVGALPAIRLEQQAFLIREQLDLESLL